jgi:hypothetical protein
MIELTYGGRFDVRKLVQYIKTTRELRTFIVQGQKSVTLDNHPKKLSLDVWLRRQKGVDKDLKQADNAVIQKLIATRLFKAVRVACPESGKKCKGLELADKKPKQVKK